MKKYMKGLLLLALPLTVALVACNEEDGKYEPAQKPTNEQVYFPTTELPTTVSLPLDETTYTITLMRQNTEGELTVELITEQDAESTTQISVPQYVTFPDGESTVDVVITYNPETTDYDDGNKVTISIADENVTTPYGSSSYAFTAVKAAPFVSLGTGLFKDGWVYEDEDDESASFVPVEIRQSELDPNVFRIMKPYVALMPTFLENNADNFGASDADDFLEVQVIPVGEAIDDGIYSTEDIQYVYFPKCYIGATYTGIGALSILHPWHFAKLCTAEGLGHNRVIAWQEPDEDGNILPGEIQLAPMYYLDGYGSPWPQYNVDGLVRILFPNYQPRDYSASLSYAGILTDPADAIFACGDLTLGADAIIGEKDENEDGVNVQAIVLSADEDPAAVADLILEGDLEGTPVTDGRIEVPFDAEELGGPKYQLIVVVIAKGKVQNVASVPFEYYAGSANPWVSLGKGYYSDGVIPGVFNVAAMFETVPSATYEVEILQDSEHPGIYRLVDAYVYGVNPFLEEGEGGNPGDYIVVNAADKEAVYIPLQNTKVDWGYGEIMFQSYGSNVMDNNPEMTIEKGKADGIFGSEVDGKITFPFFDYEYEGETNYYQGIANMGTYTDLDAGTKDYPIEIVLPGASSEVKAKAAARVRATQFERRLMGNPAIRSGKHPVAKKARVAKKALASLQKIEKTR